MGTKFAVVGSSLVVAYEEIKMFALLPQVTTLGFYTTIFINGWRILTWTLFITWFKTLSLI